MRRGQDSRLPAGIDLPRGRRAGAGGLPAAGRRGQAGRRILSGLALLVFFFLAAAPLGAALWAAGGEGDILAKLASALAAPSTLRALGFGLKQAFLSTCIALAVGLPGAWLTARYDFPGRRALRALSAVPFCVPPILVVLAFVLFYGRSGLLNLVLMRVFSLREPPLCFLFSLPGLVLVHGFYNFPIVLQNVGDVWARIPREREEAARSLGASPRAAFRVGALPSLLPALVQAAALVFLFCFFSFVVVLVFGPLGGSTLEVEIYRAVRFDADSSTAAALALIETTVALAVVFLLQLAESRERAAVRRGGAALPRVRPRGGAALALAVYALIIGIFFLGPLLCLLGQAFVVKQGMGGSWRPGIDNFSRLVAGGGGPLPHALLDSLVTALPAAFCATLVGALLAPTLRRRTGRGLAEAAFSLPLAVSGVVTALGWSLLFPRGNIGLVVLALAATALPFSLRSISASLASLDPNPALAARSLGAGRLRASLGIELPAVAPVLLSSAAFAFSMAAGDANVPILLGKGDFEPLPLLIYRLVGAYRFPEACAAGVVLALLTGFIFFLKDFGNARA